MDVHSWLFTSEIAMKYATKHEAITDYSVINKLCKYCSL